MDYDAVLEQVVALLQREQRLSYRVLKRHLQLDDEMLEDLKKDLIYAKQLAVDEAGRVLVWTGGAGTPMAPMVTPSQSPQPPANEADQATHAKSPSAEPRPPEAERCQLTVLFCDLVDSTRLARRFDPEDWRDVVRAYQQTCAEVIQRFDGYIAQYLGDGLLVYFGYPQAHEDNAQRAGRAGLGILEAVEPLDARLVQAHGIRLAVRVGVHTGPVVVGAMGSGGRQEQLALGDTPNLAARLQGLAAPNTVVVSAVTLGLIEGFFTCQALGEHALKGVEEPLQVYQLLAESGAQTRLDVVAPRGLTPLMGREQEVGLLLERWAQVKGWLGQVVVLSGEAGIGKSRLVEVLRERVGREGAMWRSFRCSPHHTNSALYSIIAHLHRSLQFHQQEPSAARLDRLEGVFQAVPLPLGEAVLGRTFTDELLRAVSSLDEVVLWRGLMQLVQAEVLYQRGVSPHASYTFKHALLQEAAYQSLLKSTRQQYHQRIAQVLEARFSEPVETQPELLARRYTAAGLAERAVGYWLRASEQSSARSAYVEAVGHCTTGLEVLGTLSDTPARAQHELDMQLALGQVLEVTKGPSALEVEHDYTRARKLCRQVWDTPKLAVVMIWPVRHCLGLRSGEPGYPSVS